jgi:hypothetical protein
MSKSARRKANKIPQGRPWGISRAISKDGSSPTFLVSLGLARAFTVWAVGNAMKTALIYLSITVTCLTGLGLGAAGRFFSDSGVEGIGHIMKNFPIQGFQVPVLHKAKPTKAIRLHLLEGRFNSIIGKPYDKFRHFFPKLIKGNIRLKKMLAHTLTFVLSPLKARVLP